MYGLEMVTRLIVMIILQYIQVLNHCVVHLKLTCFMIIIQKKITETVRCEIKKNQIEMLKYDLRKKKKSLLRNFGEKAQGSWYRWSNPFHMYLSKSISFDCAEYCLVLTKRRKLPEGKIHILFVH